MSLVLDHKQPGNRAAAPARKEALPRKFSVDAIIIGALVAAFAYDHVSGYLHGIYIGALAFFMIMQDWRRSAYAFLIFIAAGLLTHDASSLMSEVVPIALAGAMAGVTMSLGLALARPHPGFQRIADIIAILTAGAAAAIVAAAIDGGILLILASDIDLIARASATAFDSLCGLLVVTPFLLTWANPVPSIRLHVPSFIAVIALGVAASFFIQMPRFELLAAAGFIGALAIGSGKLGVRAATLISLIVSVLLPAATSAFPLPLPGQTLGLGIAIACFLVGSSIAGQKAAAAELQAFLRSQTDLICSLDGRDRMLHAGAAFRRQILGSEEAAIEAVRFDLLNEDPAEALRMLERARRGERVSEVLKIQLGAEKRAIRWTVTPGNYSDPSILTLHGEDVTESIAAAERTELQTKNHSDVLETLQKAMPCGTFHWPFGEDDPTYSTSWHGMLGYQLEPGQRFTKEDWRKLIHPIDLKRVQDETEVAPLAKVDFHDVYHRIKHADGSWRSVRSIGKVLKDEHGMPYAVSGIDFDITALEDANASSARASAAMRGGFDALSLGFAIFDEEQKLVSYNDTLLHHHPRLRDHLPLEGRSLDAISDALKHNNGDGLPDVVRKADGSRHPIVSSIGASLVAIATSLPGGETILIEAPTGSAD